MEPDSLEGANMGPECSEHQKRIARSLLGDLTAKEQQALEAHLTACSHCRSERESYIQTLHLMQSVEDEPVPHHFFVHPEERMSNPWQLFRQMKPRWQAMTAAFAGLFLLMGIAAISRLQIRSDRGGWVMSFGRNDIDVAALKKDILKSAEEKNREAGASWLQEARAEIARSRADLTRQQQTELTAALARLDSRFTGRLTLAEGRMRDDTQKLAVGLYKTVAQQRAQDLGIINVRFDSIETNHAIDARQTDAILDTLLQVAELRLK
jgi:hypothetical protein